MSKAILIMDMPESCAECRLFSPIYNDMTCHGNGWTINYPYPDKDRQDWCPLKPAPAKKRERETYTDVEFFRAQGWNACIDEILKDGETD